MPAEAYEVIVRRYYHEVIHKRHLAVLDELLAPAFAGLQAAGEDRAITGEGFKHLLALLLSSFSEFQQTIHEWQTEQEVVVTRWSLSGRQQGEYLGLPGVEKQLQATGRDTFRVVGDQIVEYWVELDTLHLGRHLTDIVPGDEEMAC